jgi:hypothetical protein
MVISVHLKEVEHFCYRQKSPILPVVLRKNFTQFLTLSGAKQAIAYEALMNFEKLQSDLSDL